MKTTDIVTANDIKLGEIIMLTTRLTQITEESQNIIKIITADNMKLKPETLKLLNDRLEELTMEIDYIDKRIDQLKDEPLETLKIEVTLTDVSEDFKWEIYNLFNKLHNLNPKNFNYKSIIEENKYSKDYVDEQ